MLTPSDEQREILRAIGNGHNVVVDAVAGSGKSTTVLHVARQFKDIPILQLTYNAFLRSELKEKVQEFGIHNLEVHTYHSFAVKYFDRLAFTDFGLRNILAAATTTTTAATTTTTTAAIVYPPIPPYSILVLDEVQDMTPLYFRFVLAITQRIGMSALAASSASATAAAGFQLLVLGDYRQSLYEFKGSDARFLTLAAQIWHGYPLLRMPHSFLRLPLHTSYRVTTPMATFVNVAMLGEDRLVAPRKGVPVTYLRFDRRTSVIKIVCQIQSLLAGGGSGAYKPSDFFILAASLRGHNNLVKQLENELVERGIPCNVPMMENESLDDRVIHGKVVFSSFHSVKGRQRPFVFVLGFSQSHVERTLSAGDCRDSCPNTLYVACTRATQQLFICEEDKGLFDGPCHFLKLSHKQLAHPDAAHFVSFLGHQKQSLFARDEDEGGGDNGGGSGGSGENAPASEFARIYTSVTDLVKFISEETFDAILPFLKNAFVTECPARKVPIPVPVVHQCAGGNYEEVSDINGITIPAMFFDHYHYHHENKNHSTFMGCTDRSSLIGVVRREMHRKTLRKQQRGKIFAMLQEILIARQNFTYTPQEYLHLGNAYIALQENLYFKLQQIQSCDYNWLRACDIEECFLVLQDAIPQHERARDKFQLEETIIDCTGAGAGGDNGDDGDDNILAILDAQTMAAGLERKFAITARVDLLTESCVFEIKCTSQLTTEHLLQLILYAWIWRTICCFPPREFKIVNIRTAERLRLDCNDQTLCSIAHCLLKNKYTRITPPPLPHFLAAAAAAATSTSTPPRL